MGRDAIHEQPFHASLVDSDRPRHKQDVAVTPGQPRPSRAVQRQYCPSYSLLPLSTHARISEIWAQKKKTPDAINSPSQRSTMPAMSSHRLAVEMGHEAPDMHDCAGGPPCPWWGPSRLWTQNPGPRARRGKSTCRTWQFAVKTQVPRQSTCVAPDITN